MYVSSTFPWNRFRSHTEKRLFPEIDFRKKILKFFFKSIDVVRFSVVCYCPETVFHFRLKVLFVQFCSPPKIDDTLVYTSGLDTGKK